MSFLFFSSSLRSSLDLIRVNENVYRITAGRERRIKLRGKTAALQVKEQRLKQRN